MNIRKHISEKSLSADSFVRRGLYTDALLCLNDYWHFEGDEFVVAESAINENAELALRIGSILAFQGIGIGVKDSHAKSRDLLVNARDQFCAANNSEKIVECDNYLTVTYSRAGEFSEARAWNRDALSRILPESHLEGVYSRVLKSLLLLSERDYKKGLEWCGNVRSSILLYGDAYLKGCFFTNYGLILLHNGRPEEAIDRLLEARDFHSESGHRLYLATVQNNIAQIYRRMNDIEAALEAVEASIELFQELDDPIRVGGAIETKAAIYFDGDMFNNSLLCAEQAINLLRNRENPSFLADALLSKAKALVMMNDVAAATIALTKGIDIAKVASGEKAAEKLAQEFEAAIRKKEFFLGKRDLGEKSYFDKDIELILPPALSEFKKYDVIRIRNDHLEGIGVPRGALAIVVDTTIRRGDVVAVSEVESESVVCGFYDYFAGIVSVSGINAETLLFRSEDVQMIGKVVGVARVEDLRNGKLPVNEVEI